MHHQLGPATGYRQRPQLRPPRCEIHVVGSMNKDQMEDYAQRKQLSPVDSERWLAPNRGY